MFENLKIGAAHVARWFEAHRQAVPNLDVIAAHDETVATLKQKHAEDRNRFYEQGKRDARGAEERADMAIALCRKPAALIMHPNEFGELTGWSSDMSRTAWTRDKSRYACTYKKIPLFSMQGIGGIVAVNEATLEAMLATQSPLVMREQ